MTEKRKAELLDKVDDALIWTLRGGNDPEDEGDIKGAVDKLGEVLKEIIQGDAVPTVKDNTSALGKTIKKVAKAQASPEAPVWAGPGGEGPQGGITQSMIGRYLSCKERFRISHVEGLQPTPRFSAVMEFGNMWHVCEESHAKNDGRWPIVLTEYCKGLLAKYPFQREEIEHWFAVAKALFPVYVAHWSGHPDVQARTPLLEEQAFDVPYQLLSGRTVRLRGKWDSVDLVDGKAIWLQENKTKSSIDSTKLSRQLSFDLQTMMYLMALDKATDLRDEWCEKTKIDLPIIGVRYNVIRRSAHKSVESMLKKVEDDRKAGRIGEWFARWNVDVSTPDLTKFKHECLDPILENLCDDYEWWDYCKGQEAKDSVWGTKLRHAKFPHHCPRHFRTPFGLYNPLSDGGGSDLDAYLRGEGQVGLHRVYNLFPELT